MIRQAIAVGMCENHILAVEICGEQISSDYIRNIGYEDGLVTVEYDELGMFPQKEVEVVTTIKTPMKYVRFIMIGD